MNKFRVSDAAGF